MVNNSLDSEIANFSTPLRKFQDLSAWIEKWKDKKLIMLGESSHGTQEFYEWRQFISNELIRNHGFNFIAVEGDWPPCQNINRFIQGDDSEDSIKVMKEFTRWPTWMWGNTVVMNLIDDLRDWNLKGESEVGFYGLDVYSLYESMDEVIKRLNELDPSLALKAKKLYSCFDPYRHDDRAYVRSLVKYPEGCIEEVVEALTQILSANLKNSDAVFDLAQNAKIVKNATTYFRVMVSQEDDSWNIRDKHMMETLDSLLEKYGPDSKGIIWAHNTHIGDYRATDMLVQGQINIGGLARQKYGRQNVSLIGFTTFTGEVIASREWDGPVARMKIPEGKDLSLEAELHQAIPKVGHSTYYVDFNSFPKNSHFHKHLGHRAIGVVYHPLYEHLGNYVPTVPAERYDAMIFIDETTALTPLNIKFKQEKIPETYPFGDRV